MSSSISFRTKALAGYVTIILLLAGGMVFAMRQLAVLTDAELALIQDKEEQIREAERLRWTGELIVSAGRGYLIAGDPQLRTTLQQGEADFDKGVRALANGNLTPIGIVLVDEVEGAAGAFRDVQRDGEAPDELARRFQAEMLPLRNQLAQSLDRLVEHKASVIKKAYADAQARRTRLTILIYGMLGLVFLAGVAIAWYFARLLVGAHRQVEEALQTARKALAARDELMGIVAHDLRNPLGAITMKAALLRRGADSEKTRQQAESIEYVTMRMEYLIRTMLDVAIMEAGKFAVTPVPCDVDDLLREAMDLFVTLSASKQVQLEQHNKAPGLAIRADRERVLQVLSNLLGNALKFTPPSGHVTLSLDRQGTDARFGVLDTGPGIASEHLPNVFDRFWKAGTPGKNGTGLGLFIAKGIIDAHGGRIWVESEPGQGARLYFTLPVVELGRHQVPGREPGIHPGST
jgi:signal transduction histidine kinase